MGKSELQTSTIDWKKRVAKYEAAGIPQSVWEPIARQDMNKTFSMGSAGMTNAEADIAVYSTWKGQSAITEAPRHKGGFFGGLETIASNIVPDIGNIITSAPRGLAELGKELVTPSTYSHTATDIAQALGAVGKGDYTQAGKDIGQSPLLNLIPGVSDINMLATKGVAGLEEHPVTSLLDVLPITKGATAGLAGLAGIEDASKVAAEAGGIRGTLEAHTAHLPGGPEEPLHGPPGPLPAGGIDELRTRLADVEGRLQRAQRPGRQALRAGRPVRAAIQRTDQAALGGRLARTQERILDKLKLDEKNKTLSSVVNRMGLYSEDQLRKVAEGQIDHAFEPLGNDIDKIVAFSEKAAVGDISSMTPEELTTYERLQTIRARMDDLYIDKHQDLVRTEAGLYPKDAPVVKAHNARDKHAAAHDEAQVLEAQAQNRLTVAQNAQQGAAKVLHKIMDEAKGKKITRQLQSRIDAAKKRLDTANQEILASRKAIRDAKMHTTAARNDLKAADARLQREIIKDPPAHLHETIRQDYRNRVLDAYNKKMFPEGISEERAAEIRQLSEYNDAIKNIMHSPIMDKFHEYVGEAELNKLFGDSVQEALKLAKNGLSPLYFHSLRESDLENITSLHIARDSDVKEAQVRHKAFNMESSVMNIRAGLTKEMVNVIRRDGMQLVYDQALRPHEMAIDKILPEYEKVADYLDKKGRLRGVTRGHKAMELLRREWTKFDFDKYGIIHSGGAGKSADIWIPKSLADNLTSFTEDTAADKFFSRPVYQKTMRVFRTSVLYGPRHFAHVVIGGIMPVLLDDPMAITEFPKLWEMFKTISQGKMFTGTIHGRELPAAITSHFDYKTDAGYKMLQTKIGNKYAELLKDYWEKTGAKPGQAMANIENAAQSMYQASVYLRDIKKGVSPGLALEHARRVVVNMDGMSPFERTIMKQIFPFYTFTRFATRFLVKLPFDHPLRVSMLSSISNQAQQEWGTGLPQTMMSLFFIGNPDSKGNISTINFRNMNPFRSISSMFTMAGFMSSLNPIISAPFVASGFNTLQGTSQLYPDVVYDAATGNLTAARPKGGPMMAAEQFIPELGGLDALFGISGNLRTLKATDQGAFDREIMNMFNIPFQFSQYNMPDVRARVAKNAYKGAQNALTQYKKTGDFSGTIGRYDLIPYQGQLITPRQFETYWKQQTQQLRQGGYTGAISAAIPKPTSSIQHNTLQELQQYYANLQQ